jgi:hypothetical protein
MLVMEICVLFVAGIVSANCLFFLGGSDIRIFLFVSAVWPVVDFGEVYLGFNIFLKKLITCVNGISHQESI